MSNTKIINFEDAKLKRDIDKTIKKLKKIYQDIEISYIFIPEYFLELTFCKYKYIRRERICTIELGGYDLEQILKFHLNNFCYEVYEKIEKEKFGE